MPAAVTLASALITSPAEMLKAPTQHAATITQTGGTGGTGGTPAPISPETSLMAKGVLYSAVDQKRIRDASQLVKRFKRVVAQDEHHTQHMVDRIQGHAADEEEKLATTIMKANDARDASTNR